MVKMKEKKRAEKKQKNKSMKRKGYNLCVNNNFVNAILIVHNIFESKLARNYFQTPCIREDTSNMTKKNYFIWFLHFKSPKRKPTQNLMQNATPYWSHIILSSNLLLEPLEGTNRYGKFGFLENNTRKKANKPNLLNIALIKASKSNYLWTWTVKRCSIIECRLEVQDKTLPRRSEKTKIIL